MIVIHVEKAKASHIVINHRTINNFRLSINFYNNIAMEHKPNKDERNSFISSVNSYLGILKHYKTYRKRDDIVKNLISPLWFKHTYIPSMEIGKVVKR